MLYHSKFLLSVGASVLKGSYSVLILSLLYENFVLTKKLPSRVGLRSF